MTTGAVRIDEPSQVYGEALPHRVPLILHCGVMPRAIWRSLRWAISALVAASALQPQSWLAQQLH